MVTIELMLQVLPILSLSIAIIYYAINVRNANKNQQLTIDTRQAQLLMQIYNKYTETELMKQQMNIVNMKYSDIDEFWNKYGPLSNPEEYTSFARLGYFFDGIGVLLKRELVDKYALYDLMGVHVLQYWDNWYGPLIVGLREKWSNPNAYEMFEHLACEFNNIRQELTR